MKQKIFITSLATVTACIVLGFIFSRFMLPVSAENGTTRFDISSDYLTPQEFKQAGDKDDTASFRRMFAAAYQEGADTLPSGHWVRCKPIYIPSGTYYISGPIVDESLTTTKNNKIRFAKYEVFGAGRESTLIKFTANGSILFDSRVQDSSDSRVIMGFSTFRDIGFDGKCDTTGDYNNTFMFITESNPDSNNYTDGVQRLQFLSCGFSHFKKILECNSTSKKMLSEITFSYCKINDCGTKNNKDETVNPCQLFTLTDPQAVNWRFDYTDIESIYGEIFHFKGATAITLNGGSVIIKRGTVFNFDFSDDAGRNTAGPGNSPQVLCNGTRFEIWHDASLLETASKTEGQPTATFRSCMIDAASGQISPNLFKINGAIDALFDDCFACNSIQISGNVTKNLLVNPTLTFRNCSDLNVDYLVKNSTITGINDRYRGRNNVHIIVDDSYDFYLYDHGYFHSATGLNECRQQVEFCKNDSGRGYYNAFDLMAESGKTFKVNPYGFVKYVELFVPQQNKNNEVTLKLYEVANGAHEQIGEAVTFKFDSDQTHLIVVNKYVETLQVEFSCKETGTDKATSLNMTIVKY